MCRRTAPVRLLLAAAISLGALVAMGRGAAAETAGPDTGASDGGSTDPGHGPKDPGPSTTTTTTTTVPQTRPPTPTPREGPGATTTTVPPSSTSTSPPPSTSTSTTPTTVSQPAATSTGPEPGTGASDGGEAPTAVSPEVLTREAGADTSADTSAGTGTGTGTGGTTARATAAGRSASKRVPGHLPAPSELNASEGEAPPPLAAPVLPEPPADDVVDTLRDVGLATARKSAFPFFLVGVVFLFVIIQDRIDRRDPKLALAPVQGDDDLEFRPPRPADPSGE